MNLNEFSAHINNTDSFKIRIDGDEQESYFSKKNYILYETVAFFGKEDIHSTYKILYHTESNILVLYNDIQIKLNFRKLRTYLIPNFEKTYTKSNLENEDKKIQEQFMLILNEERAEKLLIAEYGLTRDKDYYAKIDTEIYNLPPRGPGGPRERKNTVLLISDQPFPTKSKLTPIYKGWSY